MIDIIIDALADTVKLIPFLFLTYLAMEYLESRTGDKTNELIGKAGKFGPVIGGFLGAVPQCGFSAAASNLYAGRVITMGTLIAIYLSTSDEMLPILISSEKATGDMILSILLAKVLIGIVGGVLVDAVFRHWHKEEGHSCIHEICEHEDCHCEDGILKSSLRHTVRITFFIFIISLIVNAAIHFIGEEVLAGVILNRPILGPVLSGIVGLIPNCAASIVITQLYLEGMIGVGAMMSGLLVGAGVGLLILFRVNNNRAENLKIMGILYLIGVLSGIMIEFFNRG